MLLLLLSRRSTPRGAVVQMNHHRQTVFYVVLLAAMTTLTFIGKARRTSFDTGAPLASSASVPPNTDCDAYVRGRSAIGDEYLLQKPCGKDGNQTPKAILFLAHGCHHRMTDWWPANPNGCPECRGLPEERAIVEMALQKQLLVVAASSQQTCWSTSTLSDANRVARILQAVQFAHSGAGRAGARGTSQTLPVLALGASSGGAFVSSSLPQAFPICGFISQVMALDPARVSKSAASVWITMKRDVRTHRLAEQLEGQLGKAAHISLEPIAIAPDFFHRRIPDIPLALSRTLAAALEPLLDERGYLKEDPRQSDWRSLLSPIVLSTTAKAANNYSDSLVADQSPVSEVLNVAWGFHEMTRDGVNLGLDMLMDYLPACQKQV